MTTNGVMESSHRKVFPIQNPAWCAFYVGEPDERASAKSKIQNPITRFHHLDIQHPDSLVDSEIDILIAIDFGLRLLSLPQWDRIWRHL
jgi:hypothetical protein